MFKAATVYVLLVAFLAVAHGAAIEEEGLKEVRRTACNGACIGGGCTSWEGRCYGICYCYGSGYEYRCNYCDV